MFTNLVFLKRNVLLSHLFKFLNYQKYISWICNWFSSRFVWCTFFSFNKILKLKIFMISWVSFLAQIAYDQLSRLLKHLTLVGLWNVLVVIHIYAIVTYEILYMCSYMAETQTCMTLYQHVLIFKIINESRIKLWYS